MRKIQGVFITLTAHLLQKLKYNFAGDFVLEMQDELCDLGKQGKMQCSAVIIFRKKNPWHLNENIHEFFHSYKHIHVYICI